MNDIEYRADAMIAQNKLRHFGILGMKWGIRRYQNKDGTLTAAGRKRYGVEDVNNEDKKQKKEYTSDQEKHYDDIVNELVTLSYDVGDDRAEEILRKKYGSDFDKANDFYSKRLAGEVTVVDKDYAKREDYAQKIWDTLENKIFEEHEKLSDIKTPEMQEIRKLLSDQEFKQYEKWIEETDDDELKELTIMELGDLVSERKYTR